MSSTSAVATVWGCLSPARACGTVPVCRAGPGTTVSLALLRRTRLPFCSHAHHTPFLFQSENRTHVLYPSCCDRPLKMEMVMWLCRRLPLLTGTHPPSQLKAPASRGIPKVWKVLKETGISDHLNRLLRNLYAGLEATVRTGHGTKDLFQIGKGVHQGYILSP